MSDPAQNPPQAEFDSLVSSRRRSHQQHDPEPNLAGDDKPKRRWILPVTAASLLILGIVALIAAVLSLGNQPKAAASTPTAAVEAVAPASPIPSLGSLSRSGTANAASADNVPIAQLADPAWVSRIAAAGKIPERALFAYAGAALSVAQSNPACGIGWNTLAAIGLVESEHGTINGSHLDQRGVAVPTIIGIPLNGNGTEKVPDTDGGRIDGDPVWDRAVGPMQFIPSTWAAAGQDGNKDGAKDINQIDDAALAAAIHLCDVGRDLKKPENWIAAIKAYNPSAAYNVRVADAANLYATLR